jgi:hypothetical protein
MDSQDRYYEKKLEQIERSERSIARKRDLNYFLILGLGGIMLIALYLASVVALFFVSPGALINQVSFIYGVRPLLLVAYFGF